MQKATSFKVYNASAGSGKTFTLVKEYLKILLNSSNSYKFQQVLAITFTNKAAGEMKERIIDNLSAFSKNKQNHMLTLICEETQLTETMVFDRSKAVLNAILQNYSAFNITTIDAFTHKIIRTFAYDLKLPLNFDVEMDAKTLLSEAVDLVISKIGTQNELTDLLVAYSLQKLDDDKAWDISAELKSFAEIILNENHTKNLKKIANVSVQEFKQLKNELQKENKSIENQFVEIGRKGLEIIKSEALDISDFAYSGELPKHFKKLENFRFLNITDLKFDGRLNKTIEENKNLSAAKSSAAAKISIETIEEALKELYYASKQLYEEKYSCYILNNLIVQSLIPLGVLNYIHNALDEIKNENNVLLNAEFNNIISETVKNEPAPFIYERLGEKFRYYFIDEMQDTSEMQWQNLIPLIDNAIASENELGERGQLLLVGDAKQSIYRWRGGKAEQFIDLASEEASEKKNNPFYVPKTLFNLGTNFRSFSEVINFNNRFFQYSAQFLANTAYKELYFEGNKQNNNAKEGGYVQISFLEKEQDAERKELVFPEKVFEIISNLDSSFKKSEVCVLVRRRSEGVAVANYLSEKGIEIISSETLLLTNSDKVNFIVDLLYALQNPTANEYKIKLLYFLYEFLNLQEAKHQFYERFIKYNTKQFYEELKRYNLYFNYNECIQYSFYESIEYIVRGFGLAKQSDANIQFFLDVVFEFSQNKQVSIIDFLEYWELKKDGFSIVAPEAENAVRIMTIHKAKGLEFPVVIFPYDIEIYRQIKPKIWYNYEQSSTLNSLLIDYSEKLTFIDEQSQQLYLQRREELELDNYNLLYVALTRAVEQLYVVTQNTASSKEETQPKYTSQIFINYLKEINKWDENKNDYVFGNPERNLVEVSIEADEKNIIQQKFISDSWKNHQITIATGAALLWDSEKGEAITYGNLIHDILSEIKTIDSIDEILQKYVFKGVINFKEREEIFEILNKIVSHPKLTAHFQQNNKVFNEREIVGFNKEVIRPDRLVFYNEKVTIIDYKTGKPKEEHHQQITNYAKILTQLGYLVEEKLLVYINNQITVEEVI